MAADAAPWSSDLSPLMPAYQPAPGLYVATGPALLPSWLLRALGPALARGRRVVWIDGGNSFDAYGMSLAARGSGADPRAALEQVLLSRPFNAYQLETLVRRKLPVCWSGEPVVLSDPLALLYEEDLPLKEARRIFSSLIEGIRALPAVWVALAVSRTAPPQRQSWLEELLSGASGLAELSSLGRRWHLERLAA